MNSQIAAFAGVSLLITLVPGLDTAMVTRNVVVRGRRAGMITALGTSTGLCVHAVAVALGVSALLLRSATAFEVIKVCGAVYLGLMGLQALKGSFAGRTGPDGDSQVASTSPALRLTQPYWQGLVTNVTNPKAVVFFITFLPQLLGTGSGMVFRALALALIPVAMSVIWLSIYAILIDRIAAVLRRPAVRRWQERVLGVVFIGFGVRLATERL